jgi:hypothetical protein
VPVIYRTGWTGVGPERHGQGLQNFGAKGVKPARLLSLRASCRCDGTAYLIHDRCIGIPKVDNQTRRVRIRWERQSGNRGAAVSASVNEWTACRYPRHVRKIQSTNGRRPVLPICRDWPIQTRVRRVRKYTGLSGSRPTECNGVLSVSGPGNGFPRQHASDLCLYRGCLEASRRFARALVDGEMFAMTFHQARGCTRFEEAGFLTSFIQA